MAQVVIDTSAWTQEQRNLIEAATAALLFQAGITHGSLHVTGQSTIDVDNPSADPTPSLTPVAVLTWITALQAQLATATAAAVAEEQAHQAELSVNEFTGIRVSQVDAKIDAIATLTDLKVLLKKLVRYLVATGRH